jgi:hypothetical protein
LLFFIVTITITIKSFHTNLKPSTAAAVVVPT